MVDGQLQVEAPRPCSAQRGDRRQAPPLSSPEDASRTPRSSRCRDRLKRIVVTEQDFRRCNGDLEQLRLCHKPYAPLRRDESFKTAFEKMCREPVEQLRDPWKGIGNPEQFRQVGAIDTIFNQVLPQVLPSTPSSTDDSPGPDNELEKGRSRSSSERRSSSGSSRKSRGISREGRFDSHARRNSSRASLRAARQRSHRLPTVSGLPPIMSRRPSHRDGR